MKIAIRTDATYKVGFGHLVRGLTLAEQLKSRGHEIVILSGGSEGFSLIAQSGFQHIPLDEVVDGDESDANHCLSKMKDASFLPDVIILDHDDLGVEWEKIIKLSVQKLMVLEEVPSRKHVCDYLLVQNEINLFTKAYSPWVNPECKLLLGPEYALLKPEFKNARPSVSRRSSVKNILIFFGSLDSTNETAKAMVGLELLAESHLEFNFVISAKHPSLADLKKLSERDARFKVHIRPDNIANIMRDADLCLGAGGLSTFERFCMGLPTIAIAVADDQITMLERYHAMGLIHYLGYAAVVTSNDIRDSVKRYIDMPQRLSELSRKCFSLTDGSGCEKVAQMLESK